jgi:hypothetical protein
VDRLFTLTQRANANATTANEFQIVEVAFDEEMPIFDPSARVSSVVIGNPAGGVPGGDSSFMFGVGTGPALSRAESSFRKPATRVRRYRALPLDADPRPDWRRAGAGDSARGAQGRNARGSS